MDPQHSEHLQGQGVLRRINPPSAKSWPVSFVFDVAPVMYTKSTEPRLGVKLSSAGTVTALDGEELYAGVYDLDWTEKAQSFHVQHLGKGRWQIC